MARGRGTGGPLRCLIKKIRRLCRKHMRQDARLRVLGMLLVALTGGPASASLFPLPEDGSAVVGADSSVTTIYEDTLPDLAHRFSLGYYEIIRANPGVDVWIPGADKEIVLPGRRILPPGPREGIIVNLPEHRLYYFPKRNGRDKPVVITYPVSIGKMDWRTPLGETHVIAKIKNPSWYPPESVRKEHLENDDPLPKVVPPGPDNPLGDFAMRLAAGLQGGVRDDSHEAFRRAAIDKGDVLLRQCAAELSCAVGVGVGSAEVGAAENRDRADVPFRHGHVSLNPSARRNICVERHRQSRS